MQGGSGGAAAKESNPAALAVGLGVGAVGLVALYLFLSAQYQL